MNPEELDEARAKEALREADEANRYFTHFETATLAARLAREGWTPPEPVDPDILAFREWVAASPYRADDALCQAYLAGARMAAERERERARPLVEYVRSDTRRLDQVGERAREVLAKYRGEA